VKCVEGNTNSPELSLLKNFPLTYYHSHFLAATLSKNQHQECLSPTPVDCHLLAMKWKRQLYIDTVHACHSNYILLQSSLISWQTCSPACWRTWKCPHCCTTLMIFSCWAHQIGLLQHAAKVIKLNRTLVARMYKAAARLKKFHHVTKGFKSDL